MLIETVCSSRIRWGSSGRRFGVGGVGKGPGTSRSWHSRGGHYTLTLWIGREGGRGVRWIPRGIGVGLLVNGEGVERGGVWRVRAGDLSQVMSGSRDGPVVHQ